MERELPQIDALNAEIKELRAKIEELDTILVVVCKQLMWICRADDDTENYESEVRH